MLFSTTITLITSSPVTSIDAPRRAFIVQHLASLLSIDSASIVLVVRAGSAVIEATVTSATAASATLVAESLRLSLRSAEAATEAFHLPIVEAPTVLTAGVVVSMPSSPPSSPPSAPPLHPPAPPSWPPPPPWYGNERLSPETSSLVTFGIVGSVSLLSVCLFCSSRITWKGRVYGTLPYLTRAWNRAMLSATVGSSMADFFLDVHYVTTQPYASLGLWAVSAFLLLAPAVFFFLTSGFLHKYCTLGVPRMTSVAYRFAGRMREQTWREFAFGQPDSLLYLCLWLVYSAARGVILPLVVLIAAVYMVLKPFLCMFLLFLAINIKLAVFPSLMSHLLKFSLEEDVVSRPDDPGEAVFRLNLSFLSEVAMEAMPQLLIKVANHFLLGDAITPTATVSILFSAVIILSSTYRFGFWIARYGWRKGLRVPMTPLSDAQQEQLKLARRQYLSASTLGGLQGARTTSSETELNETDAHDGCGGEPTLRPTVAPPPADTAPPTVQSAPEAPVERYKATVTTTEVSENEGWLSLEAGQVVTVLYENPGADEVFVKAKDGQGYFPKRCVARNEGEAASDDEDTASILSASTWTTLQSGRHNYGLPPSWERKVDASGKVYYWNKEAETSTWDHPGNADPQLVRFVSEVVQQALASQPLVARPSMESPHEPSAVNLSHVVARVEEDIEAIMQESSNDQALTI